MKRILIVFTLLFVVLTTYSQGINYSAQTIKLIPQKSFMPEADWVSLLYDETKSNIPSKVGIHKQVIITPDEEIFISDRMSFTITKIDQSGRIVKSFGKKGWNPGEFASNQDLDGILNNNLLVISDNQGRINFFDLNGNFVKMISLDFMPLRIHPTDFGKLIIYGHVPYGTKSKKLLAELDYTSEKYTQIYYTFQSYDDPKGGIMIPYKDGTIVCGPSFASQKNMFCVTETGKIIFSTNDTDKVMVFTKNNGVYKKSEFTVKTNPIPITKKEKEEYYQNFKEKLTEKGIDPQYAEKVKEEGFFPDHLPYYYNLIADNKNNCLFFIYSNENKDHLFQAYTTEGKYLGESEFKIDGYDLLSGLSLFHFRDGYLYTPALKPGKDKPLCILKCKIISE